MKHKILTRLFGCLTLLALTSSAGAAVIVSTGNPGSGTTDNVLFNDGSLPHSGPLVQGNFSGTGLGFVINFTSTGGDLTGSGGQARIEGSGSNDPFNNLTFRLSDGATFDMAILNVNGAGNGNIQFGVSHSNPFGTFFETFSLNGNGQNFFNIVANGGSVITEVTISSPNTAFDDVRQVRIGGFAPASQQVPDGGSTIALLGATLLGVHTARRKFLRA